jgi:uncharacterized membrane protein YfcA
MLVGMPADVANASSRVAIFGQCATGAGTFARGGHLPAGAAATMIPPTLLGAAAGAWIATRLPNRVFEPLLLVTLVVMTVGLLMNPARFAPPPNAQPRAARGASAMAGLFVAGVYGGVLQAGAGFIFLAILASGLRYDLIRANALKALIMAAYVAVTVALFAVAGQIRWAPALALTTGSIVGAWAAARVAMTKRGLLVTKVIVVIAMVSMVTALILR